MCKMNSRPRSNADKCQEKVGTFIHKSQKVKSFTHRCVRNLNRNKECKVSNYTAQFLEIRDTDGEYQQITRIWAVLPHSVGTSF